MELPPEVKLSEEEKLETLQRLDRFRAWRSLDEKRYCLCCESIVSGREIKVTGGTRPLGPVRLTCPTPGCKSIAMDWVLPTNEALFTVSMLASSHA